MIQNGLSEKQIQTAVELIEEIKTVFDSYSIRECTKREIERCRDEESLEFDQDHFLFEFPNWKEALKKITLDDVHFIFDCPADFVIDFLPFFMSITLRDVVVADYSRFVLDSFILTLTWSPFLDAETIAKFFNEPQLLVLTKYLRFVADTCYSLDQEKKLRIEQYCASFSKEMTRNSEKPR